MEPDDTTPMFNITHMSLTHEQTAPIYGVITHYYLGTKHSPSMTFVLQSLAVIEATANISEDGHGFYASLGDIVQHSNLDASTVTRVINELEQAEVLARHRRPFKPSIFWVTWENTLLGDEGAAYLYAAQNLIWDN